MRDWKHFVLADVLIIGGTFSHVAAFARSGPSSDGLPLTLNWRGLGFEMRRWTHFSYGKMEKEWRGTMLVDFPEGTVTAKVDDDTENWGYEKMAYGLCHECHSSEISNGIDCAQKIVQYAEGDATTIHGHTEAQFQHANHSLFTKMQRRVSIDHKQCAACHPDSCLVMVDGERSLLPIESIIDAQYFVKPWNFDE